MGSNRMNLKSLQINILRLSDGLKVRSGKKAGGDWPLANFWPNNYSAKYVIGFFVGTGNIRNFVPNHSEEMEKVLKYFSCNRMEN